MLFTNEVCADHFAKDPAVVKLKDEYFLYHSVPPGKDFDGWTIGIAKSVDLTNWTFVSLLTPSQECEQKGIAAPGAIVLGDVVHLFYQTYGNGVHDAICHAVSADGVHFTKDETNPVFHPNASWCCGRAIDADVCVFNGKLHLYFATRDHQMRIQKIGGAAAELSSDFSAGAWRPLAEKALLIPEMQWEGDCIEAPACVVHNHLLYLFYGGSYNCTPQQIGCAVSRDGIVFDKVFDTPFLANGEKGAWNASESGHPFVFREQDEIYLFYQGSPDNGKTWYITKEKIAFENDVPVVVRS